MSNFDLKDSIVIKNFRKEKVMLIEEIARQLQSSLITARRRLKKWRTYTSYNHNGRYYALPDIPRFDHNGLWRYKGIFFSQYGNLKQTVIHLVNNSEAGLTGNEIGKLVRLSPRSFLSHFSNEQQIRREKVDNLFVHFGSDEECFIKQQQRRQEYNDRLKLTKLPTDAEAVIILVERIKYPHLDIEQLSARLSKKKCSIKPELIRNLFVHYGLLKKTPDTQG